MTSAFEIAKYVVATCKEEIGEVPTEMKLHKLLYFAQREALIVGDQPLFADVFEGWRFGPVIPAIRYRLDEIYNSPRIHIDPFAEMVINETLRRYGDKDPWSLSRLTHGEYSWQQSRVGISEYQNGNRDMLLDDIRIDANRVKERRAMLSSFGI